MSSIAFVESFLRARYPEVYLRVTRDPCDDRLFVTIRAQLSEFDAALGPREMANSLREQLPERARPRRLRWGRVRARKGMLRYVLSRRGWPGFIERPDLGAP